MCPIEIRLWAHLDLWVRFHALSVEATVRIIEQIGRRDRKALRLRLLKDKRVADAIGKRDNAGYIQLPR